MYLRRQKYTCFEHYINLLGVFCEFHKNIPMFIDFVYGAVLAENLKLKSGILYERIINAHLNDWTLVPDFKLLLFGVHQNEQLWKYMSVFQSQNSEEGLLFTFNNLFKLPTYTIWHR